MIEEGQDEICTGVLAEIFETYSAPAVSFDVVLPLGEKLPFLYLTDYLKIKDIKAEAAKFASDFSDPKFAWPKKWAKWKVTDVAALKQVYIVKALALEPGLQKVPYVLRLVRECGPIFQSIVTQIDLANTGLLRDGQIQEMEDEKKGSTPPRSEGCSPGRRSTRTARGSKTSTPQD